MASAGYSVANSFSHSTLKNRIAMMLKSKSPLAASLKLLYILPLVGLSLAATTRTVTDYEVRGAAAESLFTQVTTDGQDPYIQDLDKQKQDTVQFKLVDVMPQFNGGDANAFAEWVDLNLKYPEAAVKNGKEGNIVVQFTVAEDGSVGSVKILRSVDPALDKETVRVVSGSPKWTPGQMDGKPVPVTFTFAVNFKLNASYCPLRGERLPLPEDR